MLDALVGRQPIFDRDMRVHAYELLFRSDDQNRARFGDGNAATSSVILNAFVEIGLEKVVGDFPAFINFTRSFVLGQFPIPARSDRIVLEVLEDIEPDEAVIAALRAYSAQGYRIALDDFVYSEAHRPMVELADVVKLDILALKREGLAREVEILRKFDVELLAEKVDSPEDLEFCKSLGIHYFQGFFLSKPQIVKGQRAPQNRIALLRLLSRIYDPTATMKEIETLVTQDVSLSYRLVRCVNSALYAPTYRVESIGQAIMMLGLRQLGSWVSLIGLSGIEDKPHELIVTAMVRGKMCEEIARAMRFPGADKLFTVGLFSVLDALLDMSMDQILANLTLSDEIAGALLRGEGMPGKVLAGVKAHEAGDWDEVNKLGLDAAVVTDAWLRSVKWAQDAAQAAGMDDKQRA